jgi:hypothetical protein
LERRDRKILGAWRAAGSVIHTLKEEVKFNSSKAIRLAPAKVKAAVQSI